MEDRDYRKEVGKKIEEAMELGNFAELEDLIEMPSPETFAKWAELGEEKRKKRVRRKAIIASCAAILVIAVSAIVAIQCLQPPQVEAGPDDEVEIDINDMDSIVTYETWNDLPTEIKEQFIEVKNLPDGYEIEKIEIKEGDYAIKAKFLIENDNNNIVIRQNLNIDGGLPATIMTNGNNEILIDDLEVYVEARQGFKTTTYKYLANDIIIDVVVPSNMEVDAVEEIIKTVR